MLRCSYRAGESVNVSEQNGQLSEHPAAGSEPWKAGAGLRVAGWRGDIYTENRRTD